MPKVRELPPPPANPERSPPATVTGEELVTIPGLPGEPSLEASREKIASNPPCRPRMQKSNIRISRGAKTSCFVHPLIPSSLSA